MTPFLLTDSDAAANAVGGFIAFILLAIIFVVSVFLWILPGIIANSRKHHNRAAIWAITLLLGWSFIGWVVALVWAFTNPPPQPQITIRDDRHLNS